MPTYIGESKIVDRYLGDKFLEAAYIGDEKVFDPYTTITGTTPLTFSSRAAVALKNYRIYGTANGAGVATESGEPAGFKIPISLESGEQQSNYDLFIGSTKLGEEEYLDYQEQKIYKMSGSTLVPTDPPAPFPAILTYQGENTLSSTETLGEVTVKGRISAISP